MQTSKQSSIIKAMQESEKQYLEDFKTYLSVEKNFSDHTLSAYSSDIVSYILWLDNASCTEIDFNKLREYLHFIQRFDYKKTTIARKVAALEHFINFYSEKDILIQILRFRCQHRSVRNLCQNF